MIPAPQTKALRLIVKRRSLPVWASAGLRRNQQSWPMTIEFAAFSTRSERQSASEENRKAGVRPHRSFASWRIFDAPSNSPSANCGRIRQFESAQRRAIDGVDTRQFKGSPGIVAAAGIELRTMVGKRKQMLFQKDLEAGSSGLHMRVGLGEIVPGGQYSARRQCTSGSPLETAGISRASASSVRPARE